jgi:hypothetical protein
VGTRNVLSLLGGFLLPGDLYQVGIADARKKQISVILILTPGICGWDTLGFIKPSGQFGCHERN